MFLPVGLGRLIDAEATQSKTDRQQQISNIWVIKGLLCPNKKAVPEGTASLTGRKNTNPRNELRTGML